MNNLIIYLNSAAANVAQKCKTIELSNINRLAKENFVFVWCINDKIKVQGRYTKTTKIAKKHLETPDSFCKFLKEKILTAWPKDF